MFYDDFFSCLYKNKVRYLLGGGYAVNIYGANRTTCDIDIMVDLEDKNMENLINSLKKMSMTPQLPVKLEEIKSPEKRNEWINEKNMVAFSVYQKEKPYHVVDIIIKELINFNEIYKNRNIIKYNDFEISVIGKKDLIHIKSISGRYKDMSDIKFLKETIAEKDDEN